MNALSSPSLDGFPAAFYRNHWTPIGKEVCVVVLHVLKSNGLVDEINETYIALIQKLKSLNKVYDF